MRIPLIVVVCTLSLAALFGAACGSDDAAPTSPSDAGSVTDPTTSEPATPEPNAPPSELQPEGNDGPGTPDPEEESPDPVEAPSTEADQNPDSSTPANPTESGSDSSPPATPGDPSDLRLTPADFPQPPPGQLLDRPPFRPTDFADYGAAALPWLQGRTSVEAILPLFESWRMPPVVGGARLNLVDTDGDALLPDDGRSAIVIVFTDPPSEGRATGYSNLVVYEPLPDEPGVFQIVYDHNVAERSFGAATPATGVAVTSVEDATGDGQRDISFQELVCNDSGCQRIRYVLSNEGDHYRRVIVR